MAFPPREEYERVVYTVADSYFNTPNLPVLIADCIELGTTLTQQDSD